jgi:hypothetical protein
VSLGTQEQARVSKETALNGTRRGLLPVLQPFAALYVLILAVLGPLLTKESERIYDLSVKLPGRNQKAEAGATETEIASGS